MVVPRICHALVRSDLAKAQQLARTIDPRRGHLFALALGYMAHALADSDPTSAAILLGEAFANLETSVRDEQFDIDRYDDDLANVTLALIGIAETVDPDR